MIENEALSRPHSLEHAYYGASHHMSIPIRVLAVRAVLSFTIAVFVLSIFYFSGILPQSSDASETVVTGSQILLFFFGWVIFSPLLETAVLAVLYKIASNYLPLKSSVVLAAGILSALHGLIWWAWPFVVLFPILIFTIPFVQEKHSTRAALLPCALTHAFHNLYGFVCVLIAYRTV